MTRQMASEVDALAGSIRAEHEAAVAGFEAGFEHAVACGRLLIEAKAKVGHGQWLPWLQEKCGVKKRTAQLYIQLARALPKLGSNAQRVAHFSIREAVAQISLQTHRVSRLPAAAVDAALDECDQGRLVHAVRRAESVEQHRVSMLRDEEREREKRAADESAPTAFWSGPPRWSLEEERFITELSAAVRDFMTERRDICCDRVCDLLNEVYCMVQTGEIKARGVDADPGAPVTACRPEIHAAEGTQ